MIGRPKYKIGDIVEFTIKPDETYHDKEIHCVGTVEVVDSYGTFFDDSDVSYDVRVKDFDNTGEQVFVKHIREDHIEKKIGHTDKHERTPYG